MERKTTESKSDAYSKYRNKTQSREQRAKKRRKSRIIKSIFWVAVLGIAAWFFLFGNDVFSFSGIKQYFSEVFTGSAADGVAELNGTSVKDVHILGSDMLVLSDVGAMLMSKSGGESLAVQHGCTDPAISSSGNRFIIFDRGGNRFEVYNKLGLRHEGVTEYPIIDAAIASDGQYVLITGSKSYHNEVHYYNVEGEEKYTWYSAENYVYKAAVKSNGKSFAVLGMNTDSGEIYSYAFIFDPSSKAEPIKVEVGGNICYTLSYKGSDLTVIGKTAAYCVSLSGEIKNSYEYGEKELKGYTDMGKRSVLVFSKYGVGREHTLVILDSAVKEKRAADLQVDFRSVTANEKNITVLGSHEVYVYSKSLGLKGSAEISADGTYACTIGKNIFVFSVGSISKLTY